MLPTPLPTKLVDKPSSLLIISSGESTLPTPTALSVSRKRHCHRSIISPVNCINRKLNIATCINSTILNGENSVSQCTGASKILLVLLGNVENHLAG